MYAILRVQNIARTQPIDWSYAGVRVCYHVERHGPAAAALLEYHMR